MRGILQGGAGLRPNSTASKMKHRKIPCALACVALALVSRVGSTSDTQATVPGILTDEQIAKLLDEGQRVLQQGIPDRAITQYFDPIIESFRAAHRDSKFVVYAAHSPAESLMYLVTAAAGQEKSKHAANVIVVSGAWTDALELKAYALSELHRPDEAKMALHEAIALSPSYALPWIELGSVLQSEKDWPAMMEAFQNAEDAVALMEDSAQKNRMLARALRGKGFVLTELGKLDESEALYKRCLTLDADDGMAKRELEYIAGLRKQRVQNPAPEAPVPDSK